MPEFDEAYVKKLREEAASWRTKCRELEAQQHHSVIEVELAKRGVVANPAWVTVEEGQSVEEAVDALVATYPSLRQTVVEPQETELIDLSPQPKPRVTPKPVAPSTPKSTTPKPARATTITKRNISEIRKDPQARAKARDLYRSLLQKGSNQGD